MIELSFIDIALLVWAGLATAGYLHERGQRKSVHNAMMRLLDDEETRNEVVADYAKWKQRNAT
jgi:hypothetical protein